MLKRNLCEKKVSLHVVKYNFFILIILLFLILIPNSKGEENIDSYNKTIIWDTDQIIEGEFVVKEGETLIINPGVTVKFEPYTHYNTNLIIYGTLKAIGTEEKMITLTSNKATPDIGAWAGISLKSNNNHIIKYCKIRYTQIGIISDYANGTISNSIISDYKFYGMKITHSNFDINDNIIISNNNEEGAEVMGIDELRSNLRINNNTITDNNIGIDCEGKNLVIKNNTISMNGYGIFLSSNCYIDGNVITDNSVGVYYRGGISNEITNNTIKRNVEGIHIIDRQITIKYNIISENEIGISCGGWEEETYINYNTIEKNIYHNIVAQSDSKEDKGLNAKYNYWGTIDEREITEMLNGNIEYEPWSDEDGNVINKKNKEKNSEGLPSFESLFLIISFGIILILLERKNSIHLK
jgi:parallel beta-helix repeat protein